MDEVIHLPEEDRKELYEQAVAFARDVYDVDDRISNKGDGRRLCGTMTREAFELKWIGKCVDWSALPGDLSVDRTYGWRFMTADYREWDGLQVVICADRFGIFKKVESLRLPDNVLDMLTLEEHIVLFDRWMREVDPPPEAKLPWQRPPKEFEDGLDDYRQYWR